MRPHELRYLYGSASMSFAIRVVGVALLYLANVSLARSLSMAEYGQFAYIVELAAFGAVVACLGYDQIAIRVVPDLVAQRNTAALTKFLKSGLAMTVFMSLVIGAALLAAHAEGIVLQQLSAGRIILALGIMLALSILRFSQEVMRGGKRIGLSQIFEQLIWPTTLIVIGGSMLFGLFDVGVGLIVSTQIALYLLASVILFAIASRMTRSSPPAAQQGRQTPSVRNWVSLGLPLALSALMSLFLNRGDILALGFVAQPEAVANYSAASRYAALMVLGLATAVATTGALMREYWLLEDRTSLQACVDRTNGVAMLIAGPLVFLFVVIPGPVLAIYGPGYQAGAAILRILALAQSINVLTGPVAVLVIVCDMQREYALTMLFCALLMLALLAIFVPLLGGLGAACATFISLATLNLALALLVYQRTGIASWVRFGSLRVMVADVVMGARRIEGLLGRGRSDV